MGRRRAGHVAVSPLTDTLAFKPRPGCAYLQAAVDAALRAGVAPGDVAAIDVEAGLPVAAAAPRRPGLPAAVLSV
jgi:hypothetical protein